MGFGLTSDSGGGSVDPYADYGYNFGGGATTPAASGGSSIPWGTIAQSVLPLATTLGGALLANRGQTSTQTQNNIPEWQRPYLEAGFQDAARLYGQGPQQYFPGSTVAPLSQTTTNALGAMGANPNAGMWGNVSNYLNGSLGTSPGAAQIPGQSGAISSLLNGGQSHDPYGLGDASAQFLHGTLNGAHNVTSSPISAGSYGAANNGESGYVKDVMGGKYLDSGNPYAQRINSQILDGIRANVGSQFGGAGRSMSGAAARALAEQSGDASANFLGGLYENERNRQTQAADLANSISGRQDQASQFNLANDLNAQQFNSGQNFAGQQFNANQGMNAAGMAQSGWLNGQNNWLNSVNSGLGAANALGSRMDQANQFGRNYDLNAINSLPGLDAARMAGNREAFGAGTYLDAYGQRQLDDSVNRFNFNQESPWQNLARYLGAVGGTGYGGTVTSQQPGNPLLGALGGLQTGAVLNGIFNNNGATPHG